MWVSFCNYLQNLGKVWTSISFPFFPLQRGVIWANSRAAWPIVAANALILVARYLLWLPEWSRFFPGLLEIQYAIFSIPTSMQPFLCQRMEPDVQYHLCWMFNVYVLFANSFLYCQSNIECRSKFRVSKPLLSFTRFPESMIRTIDAFMSPLIWGSIRSIPEVIIWKVTPTLLPCFLKLSLHYACQKGCRKPKMLDVPFWKCVVSVCIWTKLNCTSILSSFSIV